MKQKLLFITPNVILLFLLMLSIYIVPFFPKSAFALLYQVLFTAVIISSVFVLERNRKFNLIVALLVIGLKWGILIYNRELRNVSNIPQLLFFIYIVGSLLVQIATARRSTGQMILDGLNGYFLSTIVSALLIGLTAFFSPGSFNFSNVAETPVQGMNDYIYHAIVVFSTTGFGDIIPVNPVAKSISNLISVSGQLYVAIIITLLIGHRRTRGKNADYLDLE